MFILLALFALQLQSSAQTVYIATSSGAVAYHKNKSCGYLKNSNGVKAVSTSEAKNMGRQPCSACYDGAKKAVPAAATAKKAAEKSRKTAAKTADKNTKTVKKAAEKTSKTAAKTADKNTKTVKKAVKKTTKKAAEKAE